MLLILYVRQLDDAIGRNLDGIIVYVDQAGEAPVLYAAGWKDRADQIPADPESLFKIASISKLYIATAAAKLAASGTLSLDASLADYMPGLVGRIDNADQITLRMMIQHRSGIPTSSTSPAGPGSKRSQTSTPISRMPWMCPPTSSPTPAIATPTPTTS